MYDPKDPMKLIDKGKWILFVIGACKLQRDQVKFSWSDFSGHDVT